MDWATTKRRRHGWARTVAAAAVSADVALAVWALATGPSVVRSAGDVGFLYRDYQSALGSVSAAASAITVASAVLGGLAWHIAVERPRFRGVAGAVWRRADRVANSVLVLLGMGLWRLGVLPITGIVSTPDEATMSFVVNPFAAAFLFGLAVSLWACGSVVCLLVVEADVEDQAVAAGGAVA